MVSQDDLPFANHAYVCRVAPSRLFLKTTRASGDGVPMLVHTGELGKPLISGEANPNLSHTEESDLRVRTAFGLGVDSLGATRNGALLDRGIMTSGSLGTSL